MAFASAEEHGYIKGKVTAAGLYRFAYEHRDEPLVIDDADRLLKRDDATEILKSLCESRDVKIVSSVTAHTGPNKALPSEFRTTSRVCMILNTIPSRMDLDDFAVMDRGAIAFFEPSPRELHRYVGTWFDSDHRDVYECFAQAWGWMLVLPQHVSARTYVKALSEKLRDRDWRQWILGQLLGDNPLLKVAAEIHRDPGIRPGPHEVRAWKMRTGKSRSLYYYYKRQLTGKSNRFSPSAKAKAGG